MADTALFASGALSSSGRSKIVQGSLVDVFVYGTWEGTAVIQQQVSDETWVTPSDSDATIVSTTTTEDHVVVINAAARPVSINATLTSGTLMYELKAASLQKPAAGH